jgi:hypothetical protein
MLHRCLPLMSLCIGEGSTVRRGHDTIPGGQRGNCDVLCARWLVCGASYQGVHVRLLENVLFGLTLIRATARRDKDRGVIGHMGHHFPEANGVSPEAGRADRIGH